MPAVHCPACKRVLFVRHATRDVIAHRGRIVVVDRVRSVRCEDCNATWGDDAPFGDPSVASSEDAA